MSHSQPESLSSSRTKDSLVIEDYGEVTNGAGSVEGEETLSFVPPLAIISTRVKRSSSLARLANPGVAVVHYDYQTTSLARLLQLVGDTLKARKALSIAMVLNGQPGSFQLTQQQKVTLAAVREDQDLRIFFTNLVSNFLHTEGEFARIDILGCSVGQTPEGLMMLQALSDLVQVPVFAAQDMWGADVSSTEGGEQSVPIGTLFFDGQKLKDWCNQTHQTLDKYEKISIVGQGAYGQAVLYKRKEDESLVILKKINILELNKVERQGVVNEINILAMLMHPHIITYYDHFEEEGSMMIEMEYADGGSLQQFLKQQINPLSEFEVLTKFSQMVDALQYIHTNNILHRDLKTANVFLTHQGCVKLGDFGIAKILSATQQAAQTVVGTPYYISPEICEGKFYDAKSDIWSLGCILYEMVCLQRTFEGTNLPALVHKIVEGSFNPITGKYSAELKQLIKQMLQKDAKARPSAAEILNKILPPILRPLQMEMGTFQHISSQPKLNDTNLKSFLYQLNSHNLLGPVHWPMKDTVSHVAVGFSHVIAVTTQTSVYSWGNNDQGQLGLGDTLTRNTPTLIDGLKGRNIRRSECGGEFSIFVTQNGIVLSCGRGDKGALGHDNYNSCLRPEMIKALLSHDAHIISCGESHVAMITLDQKALTWGAGAHGRLGTGSQENCALPKEIVLRSPGTKMVERIQDVHCGLDSTVFITEVGRVFACGNNMDNKLGLNRRETFIMQMKKFLNKQQLQVPTALVPTPVKELGKDRIVDCSLGPTHSAFLTETGQVYTYGRNFEGQLGAGNCLSREYPAIVKFPQQNKPIVVMCGELATIVAMEDNSFYIWGSRPAVVSPLSSILHSENEGNQKYDMKNHSENVLATDVCNSPDSGYRESGNSSPEVKETSPISKLAPKVARNSPVLLSGDGSERKKSDEPTYGSVRRSLEKLLPNRKSSEALPAHSSSQAQASATRQWSRSNLSIHEMKNTQLFCHNSSMYFQMLYDTLNKSREDQAVKQTSTLTTNVQGLNRVRRGSSSSTMDANIPEGVILHPTLIDLADKSGILLSLSDQGLEEVKLESIANFGCNLLVLIHAHLPANRPKGQNKTQATFKVGSNLRKTSMGIGPQFMPPKFCSTHASRVASEKVKEEATTNEEQLIVSISDTMMTDLSDAPTWVGREFDRAEVIPAQHLQGTSNSNGHTTELNESKLNNVTNDETSTGEAFSLTDNSHLSEQQSSLESIPQSSSGHTVTSSSERISSDTYRDSINLEVSSASETSQGGDSMLSSIHSTHIYRTNSRSTFQNIQNSGQIPETIKEAELESASANSFRGGKSVSLDTEGSPPKQINMQMSKAVPSRVQMIQAASSTSNITSRHHNILGVKKAHSNQDIRGNTSVKVRKPASKLSTTSSQPQKATGVDKTKTDMKISTASTTLSATKDKSDDKAEIISKERRGSTKRTASLSASKGTPKSPNGPMLASNYQTALSPYSQPTKRSSVDGKHQKQKQMKSSTSNEQMLRRLSNENKSKEIEVQQLSTALDEAQVKIQQAQDKVEKLMRMEEEKKKLEENLERLKLRQQELEAEVSQKELHARRQEEKHLVEIELLEQQRANDVKALQEQVAELKKSSTGQPVTGTSSRRTSAPSSRRKGWFSKRDSSELSQQQSSNNQPTSSYCSVM